MHRYTVRVLCVCGVANAFVCAIYICRHSVRLRVVICSDGELCDLLRILGSSVCLDRVVMLVLHEEIAHVPINASQWYHKARWYQWGIYGADPLYTLIAHGMQNIFVLRVLPAVSAVIQSLYSCV